MLVVGLVEPITLGWVPLHLVLKQYIMLVWECRLSDLLPFLNPDPGLIYGFIVLVKHKTVESFYFNKWVSFPCPLTENLLRGLI